MLRYKTIVISDTHLGKPSASAEFLFEFLQHVKCDRLILAGDILEGWGLKKKKRSPIPEMHARCIDAINAHAANDTEVIYLRGNHDEDLAKSRRGLMKKKINFTRKGLDILSPIYFAKSFVHTDAKGKNFLVIHGDVFDSYQKSKKKKRIAEIADGAYETLVDVNSAFRKAVLSTTGHYMSPASFLKRKTKGVVGIIDEFEKAVTAGSITDKFDGVICGHIHHAEIRQIDSCQYMNSGDWVESCRCLGETEDGTWEIIDWPKMRKDLGLNGPPTFFDKNPFEKYRPITELQLWLVRKLWPGDDFKHLLKSKRETEQVIRQTETKLALALESGESVKKLGRIRSEIRDREDNLSRTQRQLSLVA